MGTYATVEQLRAQGAPPEFSADELATSLELASRYIDRVTGFYFERRAQQTYLIDGSGTSVLELPVPLLRVDSVADLSMSYTYQPTEYKNYNRQPPANDFWYPRLVLGGGSEWLGPMDRVWYSTNVGPTWSRRRARWTRAEQNIQVTGDWGFVLSAPAASGTDQPPVEIQRACLRVANMSLAQLAAVPGTPAGVGQAYQSETLGSYSYSLNSALLEGSASGDLVVDQLLALYTRFQMTTSK
jgi:hypothetical protein